LVLYLLATLNRLLFRSKNLPEDERRAHLDGIRRAGSIHVAKPHRT